MSNDTMTDIDAPSAGESTSQLPPPPIAAEPAQHTASATIPSSAATSLSLFASTSRQPPPPPPPPYQLLGHEHLFNYFRLSQWIRSQRKSPPSQHLDAILRDASLPLIGSQPTTFDGVQIERDPNSSLLAAAFQAPSQPLQPRAFDPQAKNRPNVLSLTTQPSKLNTHIGPLGACVRTLQTIESRMMILAQEEKMMKKEKKRRKRELQQQQQQAASTAAAVAANSSANQLTPAADSTAAPPTSSNRIVLSIGGGTTKKRKADHEEPQQSDSTPPSQSVLTGTNAIDSLDEKKKKRKTKQELVV